MSRKAITPESRRSMTKVVALVGNPNAGKTTVFNALTGASQKVGNYPGVTVERFAGKTQVDGVPVEIIDVPGLYSTQPLSEDERVAMDVLEGEVEGHVPDLLVYVVDASNLQRNLFFFSQLAERQVPMIVVLTMTDLLEKSGVRVDTERLTHLLGVDVVAVVGFKGKGLEQLRAAIHRGLVTPRLPHRPAEAAPPRASAVAVLRERLARAGIDATDSELEQALEGRGELAESLERLPELQEALELARGTARLAPETPAQDAAARYRWAESVSQQVLGSLRVAPRYRKGTDRIDAVLTHRIFGLATFAVVMYLVFFSIYTLASPLMDLIEQAFAWVGESVRPALGGIPWLQSLVVDGLIAGVGVLMVFLPQIVILFFFIAVLEGSGYLARAAFLMDKLLGWCGLNGRAFIPLLGSFACAIPGIMAARVMPDPKSRLATILVAPLMSCSARLPVYLLLIGAFIEPQFGAGWAGFALFAMHLLGLVVAIPIVWVLNRKLLKVKRLPFVLEMPPYQWPKWRDVGLAIWHRAKVFVTTAGTIIVAMSTLIWALLHFPRSESQTAAFRAEISRTQPAADDEAVERYITARQMEDSYLGRFGKFVEPVFTPAGFDWRLSTAILSAFPAREVMVSSLGILFRSEDDPESPDLREAIRRAKWPDGRPLVTPWTAVGLMVFFALCCQCMSTLAAIRRETNSWKWPTFVFLYMTGLAYAGAVLVQWIGRLVGG